jgi:hypothetical protein
MEVERGMLCRGAVGAARRPYQEVIQARIDRRIREYAEVERGRNSAHPFSADAACFAVLTPPGGALFRRFFTTDFADFTDGRPVASCLGEP